MTDDLISVDEARELVLAAIAPPAPEEVGLDAVHGRVLAEDVTSPLDVPPFDSSAMDGFAVAAGAEGVLRVVGEARAGRPAATPVEPGTAVRISTGAAVPEGTGAVVPVERTEDGDGTVTVPAPREGANVRRAGEDVRAGERVLAAGTALGPAEVGMLASVGRAAVLCAPAPRVALLVTGDELTEPGGPLGPGGIYSSNGYALAAQVGAAGAVVASRESVPDSEEATRAALERALEADVVCVSGGVSVGPHDHVKGAFAGLGVEERFWGVALRPGKPTWFGTRGSTLCFGLPGNPVSAMVTFHLFARPALRALQGADPDAERTEAVLDAPVALNPRREQAVRCRVRSAPDGLHVEPTGPQHSHRLSSMLGTGALALVPRGEDELAAGARVAIELTGAEVSTAP